MPGLNPRSHLAKTAFVLGNLVKRCFLHVTLEKFPA